MAFDPPRDTRPGHGFKPGATRCRASSRRATPGHIALTPPLKQVPPMADLVLWGAFIAAGLSLLVELSPDDPHY